TVGAEQAGRHRRRELRPRVDRSEGDEDGSDRYARGGRAWFVRARRKPDEAWRQRLQILQEAVPSLRRIAVLRTPIQWSGDLPIGQADHLRAGDQSEDREGPWPHDSPVAAASGRRSDSVSSSRSRGFWTLPVGVRGNSSAV